ncbi:signal transduction histidine kinase [Rubrivivax gelatinosus]|nr:signal transduction histidine kinase [Rubrivivax gelatinosus]
MTLAPAACPRSGAPQSLPAGSPADALRALYRQAPAMLVGDAFGLGLVLMAFGGYSSRRVLLAWVGAFSIIWALRLLHYLRWTRRGPADEQRLHAWRRSWGLLVLVHGALWAAAVWLFWGRGPLAHTTVLLLVLYSFCLASVQLLASQRGLFLAYNGLVLGATVLRVASDDSLDGHLELAAVVASLFVVTWVMARAHGSALHEAIRLKARTDELAGQLRVEKAEAEAARRAAEAASRAKTQFFAAASHDLRQPLHAMSLYVEALQQRPHEPEVAALVQGVDASVRALDELFGELLDLTRLDSGGIEPRPRPLAMQPLFARLRLHFEPLAEHKRLVLRFRGAQHAAFADPVLVERVLHNLLGNAIRYTERGGVLVACRRRGGRLLLQVWDTGVGIDAQHLPRVFDEFFQVRGMAPALQRRGLGLGLAIVRRLGVLIGSEVRVCSRPGRGSVFSLSLPLRQGAAQPEQTEKV